MSILFQGNDQDVEDINNDDDDDGIEQDGTWRKIVKKATRIMSP